MDETVGGGGVLRLTARVCKNNLSLKFRRLINLKQLRWTIANEIAQTGKGQ